MAASSTYLIRQRTIIGLLLLLIGGAGWWIWRAAATQQAASAGIGQIPIQLQSQQASAQLPKANASHTAKRLTVSSKSQTTAARLESYWLQVEGQQINLVPQQVAHNLDSSLEQALVVGVTNLLADAPTGNQSSAIPAGTRLLSLRTAPEGIYVNLSSEFSQGGGDSVIYRVAQVLYTVTSLDPDASVYLSVEGQLLDENQPLTGEGLILNQPLTRDQFVKDFPLD